MLSNTINKNNETEYFNIIADVSCESESKWTLGQNIMNQLKNNNFTGLSGHVEFDKETGLRIGFKFSIVDIIKNSIDFVSIFLLI
jgi:hypothetical protein